MFHIDITSVNIPNEQKGLYYYKIVIKFNNVVMNKQNHTSFTKALNTLNDAVRIATNYNSRDGIFQENLLKHALSDGKVTHTFLDKTTK